MKAIILAFCACFLLPVLTSAAGITAENPSSNLIRGTWKAKQRHETLRRLMGMKAENPSSNLTPVTWKEGQDAYRRWTDSLKEVAPFSFSVLGNNRTVGLLTFPNSGTSWLHKLVAIVTNHPEFSIYHVDQQDAEEHAEMPVVDMRLLNHGEHPLPIYTVPMGGIGLMDIKEDDVILVKDHGCYYRDDEPRCDVDNCNRCLRNRMDTYDGIIHLVRNPYDNLVARYHIGCWDPADPNKPDCSKEGLERMHGNFSNFLEADIKKYVMQHCSFSKLEETIPSLTVVYEDLLTNPVQELKRVLRFMDRDEIPDDVIRAAVKRFAPQQAKVDIILTGVPEHTNEYSNRAHAYIERIANAFLYNGCDLYR